MDNTPPAIRIPPAEVEDASALALVGSDAYSRDPVTLCLMGEQTPEGIEHRTKELAEGIAKKDPKTRYIKAVLGEDTVIGLGIWHFYLDEESSKSRVVDLDQKEWGPGANAEACRKFFGRIFKKRERMCGQRHVGRSLFSNSSLLFLGIAICHWPFFSFPCTFFPRFPCIFSGRTSLRFRHMTFFLTV